MKISRTWDAMNARIYADHAATTPLRPEVLEAMLPHLSGGLNASSLHQEGRAARRVIDDARAAIARLIGAQPREIVFTSGGSESDNLAIFGIAQALRERGRHIVTSSIEHHAVLHAADRLRDEGWEITRLPVDENGLVDRTQFAQALRPQTTLATLMLANNEIGTISPIADFAAIAHEHGILFHTDAVQAPAYLRIDVEELGIDALSISAHKFYGPKGIGALYARTGTPLRSQLVGGSQELAKRAGTENVAAIAGMATALSTCRSRTRECSSAGDGVARSFRRAHRRTRWRRNDQCIRRRPFASHLERFVCGRRLECIGDAAGSRGRRSFCGKRVCIRRRRAEPRYFCALRR